MEIIWLQTESKVTSAHSQTDNQPLPFEEMMFLKESQMHWLIPQIDADALQMAIVWITVTASVDFATSSTVFFCLSTSCADFKS